MSTPGESARPGSGAAGQVPSLTVQNVTKTYRSRVRGRGNFNACDDVTFEIGPGAAVSLVGASGSGKSTLAKMITAVERPTTGSIRFGAVDVGTVKGEALRRYRSDVQMVLDRKSVV